jgi:hypothetical protein
LLYSLLMKRHTELSSIFTRVIRVYKLHFHIYGHCLPASVNCPSSEAGQYVVLLLSLM